MKTCIKLLSQIISALLIAVLLITNFCVPIYAENIIEAEQDGVISDKLLEMMEDNPDDVYRVIIWLEDIDTETAVNNALSKIPNYEEEMARLSSSPISNEDDDELWEYYISTKRNAMKNCYSSYTNSFASAFLTEYEVVVISSYMPIIVAELSCNRINEIAVQGDVEFIDNYCDEILSESNYGEYVVNYRSDKPLYYDIESNISYIQANVFENTWGTSGYGVNVGILDTGIPDTSYEGLNGANITVRYPNGIIDLHATHVTETAYSTAPDADFFCTTYFVFDDAYGDSTIVSELEWFIANNVDVINMSLIVKYDKYGGADEENEYGSIAKLLDKYVYNYDITIVVAAGNMGADTVSSGAMAYNVITVGNYCIAHNVVLTNGSSYNETNNTAAFKPDVCAPGFFKFGDANEAFGTSYAAPLTTGVIALLMASRASLRVNPSQLKAILTSSVNLLVPQHPTPESTVYRQYGAGVIDAGRANQIIMSANLNSANTQLYNSYQDYEIELFANQTARISLAFEKVIPTDNIVCSLANLDLQILDFYGEVLYSSSTVNNNVELIEFTPESYDTYTIRVYQQTPASSEDRTYSTPYSIAWIQG